MSEIKERLDSLKSFDYCEIVGDNFDIVLGLRTGDNEKYLRFWYEVDFSKFSAHSSSFDAALLERKKWFPYSKGGNYRKWYGNLELCVNLERYGEGIKNQGNSSLSGISRFFNPGISWTGFCNDKTSFTEYIANRVIFDANNGPMIFEQSTSILYLLGYLNTNLANRWLSALNSSLSDQIKALKYLPFIYSEEVYTLVQAIVIDNITLSKADWDAFETSWDFQRHPLVRLAAATSHLDIAFKRWKTECTVRFLQLESNEEALNMIFIRIFGMDDKLLPDVEDKDVTVRLANKTRDVKSLISYAVGCMFGRYSLDREGLVYVGGEWDEHRYITYPADKNNIIPICDDEYFTDDIVGRFVEFIKTVYGEATLDENLTFIADALGGKGQPTEVIRNYFLNDFYADHLKIYQKRPIYWLFDSGEKNGFKCLIYMHRYRPDTIARICTDYVREQQAIYRSAITDLEHRVTIAATSERVRLNKQLTKLQFQAEELREYEEKIHHLADQMIDIDLDDGVEKNYAIFKDVLAKIPLKPDVIEC